MRIEGTTELKANLRRVGRVMSRSSVASIRREAERVKARSQKYVPYDEGDLHDSANVSQVGQQAQYVVSYDTPYAVAIHEHPSRHSPSTWVNIRNARGQFRKVRFSPEGTGPKYLERALNEALPGILSRLKGNVKIW